MNEGASRLAKVRSYLFLAGMSGIVVALDQWIKFLVRTKLEFGEAWAPISPLASVVRIVHWNNTGAAFGIFPAGGMVFTVIAVIVIAAILYYWPSVPGAQTWLRVALGLQLGGAIGNLIDRLTQGTVTDYVALGGFPVFNLADACISIGVAVLAVGMWVQERRERKRKAQLEASPARAEGNEDRPPMG